MINYNDRFYSEIIHYYEQIQRDVEEAKETREFLRSGSYIPPIRRRNMVQ